MAHQEIDVAIALEVERVQALSEEPDRLDVVDEAVPGVAHDGKAGRALVPGEVEIAVAVEIRDGQQVEAATVDERSELDRHGEAREH